MTMMKILMGKKALCLALVPTNRSCRCGGFPPSFVFYYNYGCFNNKVSTTMGVATLALVFFSFCLYLETHQELQALVMVIMASCWCASWMVIPMTRRKKWEKRRERGGGEPSTMVVAVEPISLVFLFLCFFFTLWVSMPN